MTRLQMSSPFTDVKVYSSALMVVSVKLWPWPRLVLGNVASVGQCEYINSGYISNTRPSPLYTLTFTSAHPPTSHPPLLTPLPLPSPRPPHTFTITSHPLLTPSNPHLLLEQFVISGKEYSSSTCSWSSTMYTPVQFTAMITSFLGRLGPENLRDIRNRRESVCEAVKPTGPTLQHKNYTSSGVTLHQ